MNVSLKTLRHTAFSHFAMGFQGTAFRLNNGFDGIIEGQTVDRPRNFINF